MGEESKLFSASGLTARLFEVVDQMTDFEKKELLKFLDGNRRAGHRLPYMMPVACETGEIRFNDFILDISESGAFLETAQPLAVNQALTIHFQLPHEPDPRPVECRVAWVGKNGAGIFFSFESREQQVLVADLVGQLG